MSKTRDLRLDTLKTVGMLTIILAHCRGLPATVNYLRNFEVILLVLVSGAVLGVKLFPSAKEYFTYAYKRVKRLVLPTWVFLTILFAGIWLAGKVLGQPFPYTPWLVGESYLLLGGIGYVWIMSVYCFVAIGAPVLQKVLHDKSTERKLLILAALWVAYEVLRWFVLSCTGTGIIHYVLKNVLLYAMGYSILSVLGSIVYSEKSRWLWLVAGALLAAHGTVQIVAFIRTGSLVSIDTTKYPLSFVYTSYALGAALVIMLASEHFLLIKADSAAGKVISFIGKNSAWLYFHHVFLIFVWNMVIDVEIWYIMFLFLSLGALTLTWLQSRLVMWLAKRLPKGISDAVVLLFG